MAICQARCVKMTSGAAISSSWSSMIGKARTCVVLPLLGVHLADGEELLVGDGLQFDHMGRIGRNGSGCISKRTTQSRRSWHTQSMHNVDRRRTSTTPANVTGAEEKGGTSSKSISSGWNIGRLFLNQFEKGQGQGSMDGARWFVVSLMQG